MRSFNDIHEELAFLEGDDRHIALREIGESLEPMPAALKTDATLVRGCASKVWAYPTLQSDGTLHFLADAEAMLPKGVIGVILSLVQDQHPSVILATDIEGKLAPLGLERYLTKQRTNGIPGMIALIRDTATRYA
ncbi:SufE family protein [Sphingomonas sp. GM_Shp_2]|uniref:SufE family protein n=1 Tax=Sphingomonas sp. GM_Shp_2 TaxID=2937380 RepID=UPI00226ACE5F|nr:SufE family protein [Sphingomonas sp. GM_Shp_2]